MLHETWTSYGCDGREMDHTQQQQMLSKSLSQVKRQFPLSLNERQS